jgi:RES domain-containing protein
VRDAPKRADAGAERRPLRLIKLYDEGLAAARTDNQISARDHYPITQRWALAFHGHPVAADGIIYMSRYMGARKSVALFDRCHAAVAVGSATPLLHHAEFAGLVEMFELAIDRPCAGNWGQNWRSRNLRSDSGCNRRARTGAVALAR